ncbi:kinase-like domain-containing protein [Absidia repens]|uniref:Kinase-like domain-containing protein n=1 Tax=Absidia repens TaxID=90262 RepID=A0A1X2IBD8_9FUNG|nr:kinase-like domain-containing protein [Absidia repens]
MSQSSIQNPLSLLKTSTTTTQPTLDSSFALPSSHATNTSTSSRSRAGSIIKAMVPSTSPSPSISRRSSSATHSMLAKRAASTVSEALHLKLSALAVQDNGTSSPFHSPYDSNNITPTPLSSPYPTGVNASTASLSQVSESNWANKYDDFHIKEPIGYGSSAIVYGAIYLPTKKLVALKMIDLDMFERNQIDELRRETALMALSKHPNVLRVYGSFVNGSKLYIITPYLSFGSCLDIMKTKFKDGFEEITIATILKQALEGLVYLHKNGHIHRDVKAGNLLMDDQGTVLLADFGVSSSLAEKGDVRKTFVGTPCWMAPEVMEQDGYDFKADIWSFGITAYELATGHAPFAKYPPMKVLKLTLSNAPPTLDHEHTKHKYSKIFKEMIDLCLQKNPTARPSAEKLLQHPFFKQAKKKDYLCKSVLSHVSPLDLRPHKKVPEKRVSYQSTDQWDFDDTPLANDKSMLYMPSQDIEQHPTNRATTDTATTPPQPLPQQPKRRITFGDVVVRESCHTNACSKSKPSSDIDPTSQCHPSIFTEHSNIIAPTPVKKSRFIVEESDLPTSIMLSQGSSTAPTSLNDHMNYLNYASYNKESHHPCSSQQQHRYSVQFSGPELDRPPDTVLTASSARYVSFNSDSPLSPLSRVASYDNICERKSRFEVQHSTATSPTMIVDQQQQQQQQQSSFTPTMVSRESSQSSFQAQSQKLGRFKVEKTSSNEGISSGSNGKDDARKIIGRFELTGRSSTSSASSSDNNHGMPLADSTTAAAATLGNRDRQPPGAFVDVHGLYPQMEILLKQMDAQAVLLQEIMVQMNQSSSSSSASGGRSRAVSLSDASRQWDHLCYDQQRQSPTELHETVDQLQRLLTASKYERDRLTKENDGLRCELERLRKKSSSGNLA